MFIKFYKSEISHCKTCYSNSNCSSCQNNYTFIDGNKSLCVKKKLFNNKYIQNPLDEAYFIKFDKNIIIVIHAMIFNVYPAKRNLYLLMIIIQNVYLNQIKIRIIISLMII